MRHLLIGILLILVLVACSSPAGPSPDPTEVSEPTVEPTPEPTEVASPPVEPTPHPTEASSPSVGPTPQPTPSLLDEEIIRMHPSEVDNSTLPITPVEDLHRTGRPQDYDINTYRLVVQGLPRSEDPPLSGSGRQPVPWLHRTRP